jgi:hypothetical protein
MTTTLGVHSSESSAGETKENSSFVFPFMFHSISSINFTTMPNVASHHISSFFLGAEVAECKDETMP